MKKTHAATAIGVQAIEHHRRKVRLCSTIALLNAREQEKIGGQEKIGEQAKGKADQTTAAITKRDPMRLIVFGHLPLHLAGRSSCTALAGVARTSVIITSTRSFSASRIRLDPTAPHWRDR